MTEVVSDNLSPDWIKSIDVDYMFEEQQKFLVEIHGVDHINSRIWLDDPNKFIKITEDKFIGSYQFTLGKVVSSRGQGLTGNLTGPRLEENS